MKRLLALCLLGLALAPVTATSASANCRVPNCWASIAVNPTTRAWGYVYNHPTSASARRGALAQCRGNCSRVTTFRNSCGAYAVANNGGWGWSSRYANRGAAQARAMQECNKFNPGQGCRIRVWACTSR